MQQKNKTAEAHETEIWNNKPQQQKIPLSTALTEILAHLKLKSNHSSLVHLLATNLPLPYPNIQASILKT